MASERRPTALLFKGHPGCGKSTVARLVAAALSWPLIDKDDARDCLEQLWGTSPTEQVDLNALSYSIMLRYAATQLGLGLSCVVDSPFAHLSLYQQMQAIADQCNAKIALVDCMPGDTAEWRRRLEARAAADAGSERVHKPGGWQELQELLTRYAGCWRWSLEGSVLLHHHLLLDVCRGSSASNAQAVLDWLEAAGLAPRAQLVMPVRSPDHAAIVCPTNQEVKQQ